MVDTPPIKPCDISFNEWFVEGLSKDYLQSLAEVRNIMNNPIGLRNQKGEKGAPLSLEDFKRVQNNFCYFFAKDDGEKFNIGRIYRQREVFQKCLSGRPEQLRTFIRELRDFQFQRWRVDKTRNEIVALPDDPRSSEMYQKLYHAYLLMREYVEDDRILFT